MNKKVFVSIIAVLLGLITLMVLCEISCAETVEPFTVSAYQNDGHLVITPNTCGKLSQIVITCDPPAHFRLRADGTLYGRTTAISGYFSAILCENNSCTPVEFDFDVAVYGGNTPTLASADAPTGFAAGSNMGGVIVLIGLLVLLVFFIFWLFSPYDEDQWG